MSYENNTKCLIKDKKKNENKWINYQNEILVWNKIINLKVYVPSKYFCLPLNDVKIGRLSDSDFLIYSG